MITFRREEEPKAIIEDGIVVNANELKRYWAKENERKALARRTRYELLRDFPPEPEPVKEKIIYHTHHLNSRDLDKINQNTLHLRHLDKKVSKLMSSRTGTFGTNKKIPYKKYSNSNGGEV